jgi:hypothetical protein
VTSSVETEDCGQAHVPRSENFGPVGNFVLRVSVDSGSTRSLIPLSLFNRMQLAEPRLCLSPVSLQCFTASGQKFDVLGKVELPVKIHG